MEESTPKKGIPVALVAGIAAVALLAVAAGGWFGLCAWVRDNGQLLPGAVAVDDRGETVAELGKLTREDALDVVSREMEQRLDTRKLTLLYGEGRRLEFTGELMDCSPEAAVDVGFTAKENTPFWKLGALWLGLADEPTGALDSRASRMLLKCFEEMNGKLGATILMVTHDAFTASYASRILFIKDGGIFSEIRRGNEDRKSFFGQIIDVVTLLGGDLNDAV